MSDWIHTRNGQALLAQLRRVAGGLKRVAEAMETEDLRRVVDGGTATPEQVDEAVRRGWIDTSGGGAR